MSLDGSRNAAFPRSRAWTIDTYFLEHRAKVIDVAAFFDRVDRAGAAEGAEDVRLVALRRALAIAADGGPDRARRILELFSDPTLGPIDEAPGKGACGVWPAFVDGGDRKVLAVAYIDPHIHMVSRTTDDYRHMATAGCVAVTEPAFWAGFDRSSPQGFYDYFRQLTEVEPMRAADYGIRHYTWICINPKEGEDVAFARDVIQLIPEFLARPTALGVGEIGLNKNSKNELEILEAQIELAARETQLILVHTPHLEDKKKGTRLILDALANHAIDPGRVLIDHVEEHTVELVLDRGYWAGMTLYPDSKCTPQRAADIIECYGDERLWINSAGDWGHSDPLAVPKCHVEMLRRGHPPATIRKISLDNPRRFLSQSPKFALPEIL